MIMKRSSLIQLHHIMERTAVKVTAESGIRPLAICNVDKFYLPRNRRIRDRRDKRLYFLTRQKSKNDK